MLAARGKVVCNQRLELASLERGHHVKQILLRGACRVRGILTATCRQPRKPLPLRPKTVPHRKCRRVCTGRRLRPAHPDLHHLSISETLVNGVRRAFVVANLSARPHVFRTRISRQRGDLRVWGNGQSATPTDNQRGWNRPHMHGKGAGSRRTLSVKRRLALHHHCSTLLCSEGTVAKVHVAAVLYKQRLGPHGRVRLLLHNQLLHPRVRPYPRIVGWHLRCNAAHHHEYPCCCCHDASCVCFARRASERKTRHRAADTASEPKARARIAPP